jgi:hypothetical protein
VGDIDGGGAQATLQTGDLGAHLHPQLGIEVAKRLVHEEGLGVPHDRPSHGHPLALTAGELGRLAVQQRGQVQHLGRLGHLGLDLGLGQLGQSQREGDVLAHRHVRVQRVGLEDHRDVAVPRRLLVDPRSPDAKFAGRDVLQAGDHVERGRLSATRRPDENHELAIGDGQRQILHGRGAVGIALCHMV